MLKSYGARIPTPWQYRCCKHCRMSFTQHWSSAYPHHPRHRYHPAMDTRLLELLVCPVTKGPLDYDREKQELISRSARLAYPVRDGIPVLLENEARVLSDTELGL